MREISHSIKIDGKQIAQRIKDELKKQIARKKNKPGLAIILVGDDSASHTYVNLKKKACEEIGMYFEEHIFEVHEKKETVLSVIDSLNKNPKIHGIIIQLPLPKHLPTQKIINAMNPKKDADGFHPKNIFVKPVMAEVVLEILRETKENFNNKKIFILGKSPIFLGTLEIALAPLFKKVITLKIENAKKGDVIISALGIPHSIKPQDIPEDIGLIDIGVNFVNGKIVGDIDPACYEKAKFYTPVPGGVGPITVAKLLENVYKLFLISTEK